MATKVHELAKELGMNSKELLEKINAMGIEAKSHMSGLKDEDVTVIRNSVRGRSGAETKIVKAAPKKVEKKEEEPKVVVKAAARLTASPVNKPAKHQEVKEEKQVPLQKPPVGKPLPRDGEQRPKPPIGKPLPKDFNKDKIHEEENKKAEEEKAELKKSNEAAQKNEKVAEKALDKKAVIKENEIATGKKAEIRVVEPESGGQKLKILKKFDPEAEKKAKEEQLARKKAAEAKAGARKDSHDSGRGERRDRNDRSDRGDRGGRFGKDRQEGGRPERRNTSAPSRGGDRGAADIPQASMTKHQMKREDKDKDRDRDKFSKLEKGGRPKQSGKLRSLEKAPKPKKHQQKPKVVEEPEIMEELPVGTKMINVPITVAGFCEQLEISTSTVIMKLMKLGIMANINQNIDEDTVLILADELGVDVVIGKVEEEAVEEGIENFEDKESDLKPRAPIVTVMGHVDHGKTSLLDAIRKTNVTASESGGITQHIGASEVNINGHKIVFLDTPGHEAFTAMRARGAHGADIAILVVAADDSVKPQTIESISHAKAAGVPIIVAINKIDKPGANPDRVKQDLTEHGILVEDWGGDTISVPVSAKSGEGIRNLLEMVLLQAEMMELKANPNRLALGTVIEARLDKAKGPVATLLVTNGTLQAGMSVVAGTCSGRIRLMTNFKGDTIRKAGPATAVEILGLTDVPEAGDVFNAVREDKVAREIAESRKAKLREEVLARNASTTLEQLFSQIQEGEIKELNLIVKGDVQGSVGALESSLEKLKNENVRVKIIHSGVGTVTESDVMLAGTSGAVIIGFNVRPSVAVTAMAEREGVQIRTYRVIYDVIDDVENAMKGMLDPEFKEELLGTCEVRTTFKVPGVGTIAGAYVLEGKVVRNADIRLVRDGIVYHEGKISSLKRFKDDAREVQHGFECGIGFENYNDLKEGDIIECFHMVEVERK